jgi:XRE family transcriptional regulator, regulator of sulfur utilization
MSNPERQCPPEFLNSQLLFGARIRAIRDSLDLSREVVAERAGIDSDYFGEIERGEKWPALWMTRAIARVLGVSPDRFFQFEDEPLGGATPLEKLQRLLDGRSPKEQDQALRVTRALFGL